MTPSGEGGRGDDLLLGARGGTRWYVYVDNTMFMCLYACNQRALHLRVLAHRGRAVQHVQAGAVAPTGRTTIRTFRAAAAVPAAPPPLLVRSTVCFWGHGVTTCLARGVDFYVASRWFERHRLALVRAGRVYTERAALLCIRAPTAASGEVRQITATWLWPGMCV